MQPRVPILILHLLVPGNPGLFEVKKISKDDSNLSNMLAWMNFFNSESVPFHLFT